jgi:NADH:ubiquinone oxidoreductase subunit 2 (subunit N)
VPEVNVAGQNLIAILPLLVLSGTAFVVLILATFFRSRLAITLITLAGLALAFAALPIGAGASRAWPAAVGCTRMDGAEPSAPLFILDLFSYFYIGLLIAGAFAVIALSYGYLARREGNHPEYCLLISIATLGSCTMAGCGCASAAWRRD